MTLGAAHRPTCPGRGGTYAPAVRFGVLGPLEVRSEDGTAVDVGGRQPRVILASLLAAEGRHVSADALVDAVWGDDPPPSAVPTLQSYVSRLRKLLAGEGAALTHDEAGYRLVVDPGSVDLCRYERLAEQGRAELAAGRTAEGRATLATALALWRGPALAELADRATGRCAHASAASVRPPRSPPGSPRPSAPPR